MRAAIRSIMLASVVSACSVTEPVVATDASAHVLKGSTTGWTIGGTLAVTDGTLSCTGSYDARANPRRISVLVRCSDGRSGVMMTTRDSNGLAGAGAARMTDGSKIDFVFGSGAAGL